MHVKSWVLGVLSEKTEKRWTAAHLWWSPAAHSVCQLPGNDSEAMPASLSAITTASAKWVGEGRWWLPEAPSDYQGCCAKGISRVHSLHTIKTACKWASCVCRVNELLCTEACACMAYDWHWFWWIRVSEWWWGVGCQLVVVMPLKWNADGKEPVIYDCYWTYGTRSCYFFRLNKDIGNRQIYRICGFFSSIFSNSRYVGHKINGNYFDSIQNSYKSN